jgi:hypothetical protein
MCHRIAQGWEIAKHMRGAVERGRVVIGVRSLVTFVDNRPVILIVTLILSFMQSLHNMDLWRMPGMRFIRLSRLTPNSCLNKHRSMSWE